MESNLSAVLSLSTAVLFLVLCFNNFDAPPLCSAQEENYHEVECVLPDYFLCDNGNCIPESHLCNGDLDCGSSDSSDEATDYCSQLTCNSTTEFKCASGRCIPLSARCDRTFQCNDRSDEEGCTYSPCPPGKFSCANHSQCLDMSMVCDGIIHCLDKHATDELHPNPCPANVTCPSYAFKCKNTNVCALPNWMNNGIDDCGDNSDEDPVNYKNFKCPEDWFRCGDDRCIPMSATCNGVIDCTTDGLASDERHPYPCPKNVTCPEGFFSCEETNICAHPHWLCDGANDCGDNSDENVELCARTPCPEDWFRCKSHRCIPPNWRCDSSPDCDPDGEDEDGCEAYYEKLFMAENSTLAEHLNSTDDDEDYQRHPNTEYQLTALDNERTQAEPVASVPTKPNKANLISSYLSSSQPNTNAGVGAKSGKPSSSPLPPS